MKEAPTGTMQAGASRFIIQKMVLENFKSYGGVREVRDFQAAPSVLTVFSRVMVHVRALPQIGPFHKQFSAIVGPNGSGKSNVIDAMLFVFGKRAKKLRLNKVSELIHKSELYPNNDSARVSVHFCEIKESSADCGDEGDNEDYDIVPESEVVVTRVAFANNQSKYMIDGRVSSFTEVGELLRARRVDLDNNRFLILQGEVEQIAMMKPKAASAHEDGLLEYLEDIIGSNKYVESIEEADAVVESACEARSAKLNRVKLAEKEVAALEQPKMEAEAYVIKEDEVRRAKGMLYQVYAEEARSNAATLTERHAELSARLETARSDREQAARAANEAQQKSASVRREHCKHASELDKTRRLVVELETREIEAKEEAKHRETTMKKLRAAVSREGKEVEGREAEILARTEEGPAAGARVETAAEAAERAEEALGHAREEAQSRTASARAALEAAQRERLAPAKAALDDALGAAEAAAAEVEAAERGPRQAKAELDLVQTKLATARRAAEAAEAALAEVDSRMSFAKSRVIKLEAGLAPLAEAESKARRAAFEASAALEADRTQRQQCEEARAAAGAAPRPVAAVLKAAEGRGELASAGVRGRLGDLGCLPPEYDVAVSTACGDMLDHVVVQTGAGGQRCIDFLRARGVGRASFIVLDELGQWRDKAAASRREPMYDAPRLIDLIQPESDEYAPAFYMAVRDTLVAKDLDSAVAVAYVGGKRRRVVTRNGQLIDSSGTMSGGGGKPRSGKMRLIGAESHRSWAASLAVADKEEGSGTDELERTAEQTAVTADEAARAKAGVEAELRAAKRELENMFELERPRIETELKTTRATLDRLESRANALQAEASLSSEQKPVLDKLRLASRDAANVAADRRLDADRCAAEVDDLRRAVVAAGGPDLERATAAFDQANQEVDAAKAEQAALGIAIQAAEKALKKACTAKAKAERELDKLVAAANQADSQLADIRARLEAAKEECRAAVATVDALADDLADADTKVADYTMRLNDLKAADLDISNQMDDYIRAIRENKTKHQHWLKEIAKLRASHRTECETYPDLLVVNHAKQPKQQHGDDEEENEDEGQEPEEASRDENQDRRELPELSEDELRAQDKEDLKYRIALLEAERDGMRTNVNLKTIEEYNAKQREYRQRLDELAVLTEERNKARDRLEALRRERLEDFMCGFGQIALKLKENYQLLTLGGDVRPSVLLAALNDLRIRRRNSNLSTLWILFQRASSFPFALLKSRGRTLVSHASTFAQQ